MKKLLLKNEFINNNNIISIIIIFIIVLSIGIIGENKLYYDSSQYWGFSKLFEINGVFDFGNYNATLRGFSFPFILYIIGRIANFFKINDPLNVLYLFNALMFSLMFGFCIPKIFEKMFKLKIKQIQILIFFLIVCFFWRGFFEQVLSDFTSFFSCLLSFYLILNINKTKKKYINIINILFTGVFIGLAINIRPSYNIIIPIFLVYLLFKLNKEFEYTNLKKKLITFFFSICILVIGSLVILLPQLYLNKKNFNKITPFVLTITKDGNNLFIKQLLWGMEMQKYETSINNSNKDLYGGIIFEDLSGKNIIKTENIVVNNFNLKEYTKLVFKYPVSFSKIYFKHIFNSLDIKQVQPYIKNIGDKKSAMLFSFINYTLWYAVIIITIKLIKLKKMNNYNMMFFSLIIFFSIVISVPTAIEVRFMLPLYIFCYCILCFSNWWKDIKLFNKKYDFKKNIRILNMEFKPVLYLIFLLICFSLSAETYICLGNCPIIL